MQHTRPATWGDVKQLARYLADGGAEYALATEGDVFASDGRYAIRFSDEFTVDVMPSIAASQAICKRLISATLR